MTCPICKKPTWVYVADITRICENGHQTDWSGADPQPITSKRTRLRARYAVRFSALAVACGMLGGALFMEAMHLLHF